MSGAPEQDISLKNFGLDYDYNNKIHKKKNKGDPDQKRKITSTREDEQLKKNGIETSKYTNLNFIPKNLMLQFSKMANQYFLVFGIVQMQKDISISSGVPTIYFPLATILIITAIKDYYEDYKRKRSDREENHSRCEVHRSCVFIGSQWKNLMVGDVVKVTKNKPFPADLLIVNTSEPKGQCFIETKGLDGETNLKQRKCQQDILHYFQSNRPQSEFNEDIFSQRKIIFSYEQPNPYLEKFEGFAEIPNGQTVKKVSINVQNILLRGCSLKNTKYVYGLVVNTGHDTKIMKNSFNAKAKKSGLEKIMNTQILLIFIIQIIVCLFCGLYYLIYFNNNKDEQNSYMHYEDENNSVTFFKKFGTWFLIFGNFVPISLLVTLEFVKLFQAVYIYYDDGRFDDKALKTPNQNGMIYKYKNDKDEEEIQRTIVQSSNLNEELGQIEYIFSDKTGTLTCNIMRFKKISINGISYGDVEENDEDYIQNVDDFPQVTNCNFRDMQLIKASRDKNHPEYQKIRELLIFLACTHNIVINEEEDPDTNVIKKSYSASSPDELALVNFAKFCGIEYMGQDEDDKILIKIDGEELAIPQLQNFEFDSNRKKQSVIIKDPQTGQIKLYCKGADSIILKSTDVNNSPNLHQMTEHLEKYSLIGLRTLLLSYRVIDAQEYKDWEQKYQEATTNLDNREKMMFECQKEIEKDLIVIGATAIEDQLQDEVGETIAALKQAGIKVWVLTGDKVETARNIGLSCKLLHGNMIQHKVSLTRQQSLDHKLGEEETKRQLQEIHDKIKKSNKESYQATGKFQDQNALIITGDALHHGLHPDVAKIIVKITQFCAAVLCCRVSPKQKQEIVTLVRNWNTAVSTLAIGDGANDVNMITAAHVGVGIKGLEGQQASRASDYAIGEFKILRRLLFFHGKEAYRRNANLVCYNFYKNILLVTTQFWFAFQNFFAGQTLYDSYLYQIYNVVYTSMPIVIYAVMDLEFNPAVMTKNQINYYIAGIQHALFNGKVFWQWFITGLIQAFIVQYVAFESLQRNFVNSDGHNMNFWGSGTMVYGMVVVIVNIKVLIISYDHTVLSLFFNLGSLVLYLLTLVVMNNIEWTMIENLFGTLMSAPYFHFGNILGIVATSFIGDFAQERWVRGSANSARTIQQRYIKKFQIQPLNQDLEQNQGLLGGGDSKPVIESKGYKE